MSYPAAPSAPVMFTPPVRLVDAVPCTLAPVSTRMASSVPALRAAISARLMVSLPVWPFSAPVAKTGTVTLPTRTVTWALSVPSASVAVTVQLPSPTAVTTPFLFTLATEVSLLSQNSFWPPFFSAGWSATRRAESFFWLSQSSSL